MTISLQDALFSSGGDESSLLRVIFEALADGKDPTAPRVISRYGLDPSVMSWYYSKIPAGTSREEANKAITQAGQAFNTQTQAKIASGELTPEGLTQQEVANNQVGNQEYQQRLSTMSTAPQTGTAGVQTYSTPLTGTTGIQNAINLASNISTGLNTLADKGYGNTDISQLPQNVDVSQLPQAGNAQVGNTPATSTSAFNAAAVGLPPEFQGLYDQFEQYLGELEKRGQVLNPNIEITPQQVLAFTQQAEAEINPYYSGQLKLAKEGLQNTLGYSRDEIIRSEQEAERKYGRALQNIGENAAEQGFAQSGRRIFDEKELATDTQNQVDSARRQLSYQAGNAARNFAQSWGSTELPNLNFGQAPQVAAGESRFGKGADSPLYTLSNDVYNGLIGEQEFARRGAVASRTSGLEEAFRESEALKQARALTL